MLDRRITDPYGLIATLAICQESEFSHILAQWQHHVQLADINLNIAEQGVFFRFARREFNGFNGTFLESIKADFVPIHVITVGNLPAHRELSIR